MRRPGSAGRPPEERAGAKLCSRSAPGQKDKTENRHDIHGELHRIASHRTAPHRITLRRKRIATHRNSMAWHCVPWHRIPPHCTAPSPISSRRIASHHIRSHHTASNPITPPLTLASRRRRESCTPSGRRPLPAAQRDRISRSPPPLTVERYPGRPVNKKKGKKCC